MPRKLVLNVNWDLASKGAVTGRVELKCRELHASPLLLDVVTEYRLLPEPPHDVSPQRWTDWTEVVAPVLLPKDLRRCLIEQSSQEPLRIYLNDSSSIPWEGLCHPDLPHGQLTIGNIVWSRWVPTSNHAAVNSAPRALVAYANPGSAGYPRLSFAVEEAERLAEDLRRIGFAVTWLPSATRASLMRAAAAGPYRLFHYSGHADLLASGTALLLETGELGTAAPLYGDELAETLRAQMVVLVGCQTGNVDLAGTLCQAGTEAVVGFQTTISDVAGGRFSSALYSGLLQGSDVAESVHSARALLARSGAEWYAPVLFVADPVTDVKLIERKVELQVRRDPVLPIAERAFFGRAAEVRHVTRSLQNVQTRLLTITGLGGMGKTRLALHVARGLQPKLEGRVFWVDCSEVVSHSDLCATIGSTLAGEGDYSDERRLGDLLAEEPTLLVLDCFEKLTAHAALISRLLRTSEELTVLVTSRRLLCIPEEHEFPLGPLRSKGAAELRSATELFESAACQANHAFRVNRTNREQVRELVEALEAMPLALVLAAGRLRTMTLTQLLERVRQQRLKVLNSGGSDRHANMVRVVHDSFQLLGEEERDLMYQCSAFHGGFTWDSAEAVLQSSRDLIAGVTSLRENSLLDVQEVGAGVRFRILDTIREYIEDHARPEELEAVRLRHCDYFLNEARRLRKQWDDGDWTAANSALWAEVANLRAAVNFACDQALPEAIRGFASTLLRWYLEAGLRGEFGILLSAVERVSVQEPGEDPYLMIEVRGLQGEFMRREQRAAEATAAWLDRATRCHALGEIDMTADTYTDIASLGLVRDERETVEAMLARIDALDAGQISPYILAAAQAIRARAYLRWTGQEEAVVASEMAERLISDLQVDPRIFFIWLSLSMVYRSAGRHARSERIARNLLSHALDLGHYQAVARGLLELARTREALGDLLEAGLAIEVAGQIPRKVSTQVRAEVQEVREKFLSRHGERALDLAIEQSAQSDWKVLATSLRNSSSLSDFALIPR